MGVLEFEKARVFTHIIKDPSPKTALGTKHE